VMRRHPHALVAFRDFDNIVFGEGPAKALQCWSAGWNSHLGLEIPRTLREVCDPKLIALLVYNMQVSEPRWPK
jgi:hypothetical protein